MELVYEEEARYDYKTISLNYNLYLGIDIGINNLAALTSNKLGLRPILVNGRPLKSINQFYNKTKAKLQSFIGDKGTSNRIRKLNLKRMFKIKDYMHKASRLIIDYCYVHGIGNIVIGHNNDWKQNVNLGKVTNQNFVAIPFNKFIDMIKYKAEEIGIKVHIVDEAYTSKCSFLDLEPIEKHDHYKGRRIRRGLFRSSSGRLINADINASYNIIRKVAPNLFRDGIEDVWLHPVKITL